MDEVLVSRIEEALRKLSPYLSVDGGGVELVRFHAGTVHLRLTGNCIGCPGADITLKYGIESALRQEVPEIQRIALEE
ncbi:MAG: NifU family protein [Planctomycetota bacterium]